MSLSLVDSHCHLPLVASPERSVDRLLEDAANRHVDHVLCVAVDLETLPGVIECTSDRPGVFASVGVHPNTESAQEEPSLARLLQEAARPKVVAIGETGLDYYH